MYKIEQRLAKIEQATKHLRAQPPLTQDEHDAFTKWCDMESMRALVKLENKEIGEFLTRCSDELLQLLLVVGDEALTSSDEELMQSTDEQTVQKIVSNKSGLAKWRDLHENYEPKTLADWLRGEDKEMKQLARHLNEQMADFRAIRKAGLLIIEGKKL
jgi:hypothetical protein